MASDEELCSRLTDGDDAALEVLLGRYQLRLAGFLHRQTGGRDVDDLYQEVWMRVVRSAGRFDPDRRFSTWLFQIAVNLCRDWHRRRPPEPVETPDEALVQPGPAAPRNVATTDATEAALDAERLLAVLTPEQREALVLRYHEDLSEARVATILGIPAGTVKSRVHNALRRLGRLVAAEKEEERG